MWKSFCLFFWFGDGRWRERNGVEKKITVSFWFLFLLLSKFSFSSFFGVGKKREKNSKRTSGSSEIVSLPPRWPPKGSTCGFFISSTTSSSSEAIILRLAARLFLEPVLSL